MSILNAIWHSEVNNSDERLNCAGMVKLTKLFKKLNVTVETFYLNLASATNSCREASYISEARPVIIVFVRLLIR